MQFLAAVTPPASISPETHINTYQIFCSMLPVAVSHSSSGSVDIMLCTSGFVDQIIFSGNLAHVAGSTGRVYAAPCLGRSLTSTVALLKYGSYNG